MLYAIASSSGMSADNAHAFAVLATLVLCKQVPLLNRPKQEKLKRIGERGGGIPIDILEGLFDDLFGKF